MSLSNVLTILSPTFSSNGARIYDFAPSEYWIKAIREERLGSYSIANTSASISIRSRLKSIKRYIRLCPPPRNRVVMRPYIFRPPDFFKGFNKDFSGLDLVISAKSEMTVCLNQFVVGLNFFNPIFLTLYF